ncbi:aldehyde dehydrogenase [Sinobacterium caligoides]|nr:aldehyde dehydrogenase [Sinobacterium caligoides]
MTDKTKAQWQTMADKLKIEARAFINGHYVDAHDGATRTCYNPATGTKLADVANCGIDDADRAVQGARDAFESGIWSKRSPDARRAVMVRWAQLLEDNADELALLETLDVGKPIRDTTGSDVPGAIRTIRWSGEAIDKIYEQVAPTSHDTIGLVTRIPLGVVAAIVPWNFPLSTTAWKLGPALASGNSVILKPASNTPLTAIRIAGLAKEAGLPDGVLQVLPGPGSSMGAHLATHMDIDGLTFTGSTPIGKKLLEYSGQSNLKRVFNELGGKSPNIVFADADLEKAAEAAAMACFYNGGQTCTAGTRLIVEESIHDRFVDMVIEAAKAWQPGDIMDPATAMGPMIDQGQYDTVKDYIAIGDSEGCTRYGGDSNIFPESGGLFLEPVIFTGVDNSMRIAQEEVFGPVLAVIPFKTKEEAINIANDSIYGLGGAIWSRDISNALSVAEEIRVGTLGVNNYFGGDITVPFGGFKQSGNGRDKSIHAFDDYTELKTTWIEL